MQKKISQVTSTLTTVSTKSLDTVDDMVETTTKQLDSYIAPVRTNFAARYPTLFAVLVTFGVAATFLGFEQILLASSLLERYHFLILLLGVSILALTGTLYKKL